MVGVHAPLFKVLRHSHYTRVSTVLLFIEEDGGKWNVQCCASQWLVLRVKARVTWTTYLCFDEVSDDEIWGISFPIRSGSLFLDREGFSKIN